MLWRLDGCLNNDYSAIQRSPVPPNASSNDNLDESLANPYVEFSHVQAYLQLYFFCLFFSRFLLQAARGLGEVRRIRDRVLLLEKETHKAIQLATGA